MISNDFSYLMWLANGVTPPAPPPQQAPPDVVVLRALFTRPNDPSMGGGAAAPNAVPATATAALEARGAAARAMIERAERALASVRQQQPKE